MAYDTTINKEGVKDAKGQPFKCDAKGCKKDAVMVYRDGAWRRCEEHARVWP